MGEPPQQKSGNTYGFVCYEYAAVYSATGSAVIMAKDGKVVFFGHTNLPLGTVDLKFTGVAKATRIEGAVNVELDSLFGDEQDTATLYLSKA